jgi:hypothetical protein
VSRRMASTSLAPRFASRLTVGLKYLRTIGQLGLAIARDCDGQGVWTVGTTVYAATGGGPFVSTDGGQNWSSPYLSSNTVYGVFAR